MPRLFEQTSFARERIFRTLECFALDLSLRLIDFSVVTSVIWLHDGLWVSRIPEESLVEVIDRVISEEFRHSTGNPLFMVKSL